MISCMNFSLESFEALENFRLQVEIAKTNMKIKTGHSWLLRVEVATISFIERC